MKVTDLRGMALAIAVGVCTAAGGTAAQAGDAIPDIKGSWSGENLKLNDKKGFTSAKKTIHITEQQDRRFKGYFNYMIDGEKTTKNFFGIIYPDNKTLSWVATDSKGYVHGNLLEADRLSACYIETGALATVGCADMKRFAKQAQK